MRHSDGKTAYMTNLIFAFSNFAQAPNKYAELGRMNYRTIGSLYYDKLEQS
jgi:hypothetical protein